MHPHPTTIKHKLMAAMLGTSLLVLAVSCTAFIVYQISYFRARLVDGMMVRAELIGANSTAALAFQNAQDATEVLSAFKEDRRVLAGCLYDADGRLFATYPAKAAAGVFPRTPHLSGHEFQKDVLEIYRPVRHGARRLGTVFLRFDLSALTEQYRLYAILVLCIITLSGLVAFGLAAWLQRGISRPILSLVSTARAVSERRDYSLRAGKSTQDEIGTLTDSFNDMLNEIEQRDQSLRALNLTLEQRVEQRTAQLEATNRELESFSYSVSHDLRAPVRHIDGFSNLLLRHMESSLDDRGRHYLNTISAAAVRMGTLIDDLLTFSRMGRTEMLQSSVDLRAVVDEVVAEVSSQARGRKIEWKIGALPTVTGDPAMLRVVLTNLVSNAVKYTGKRDAAVIEIDSESTDDGIVVKVRDNGTGFDMQYAHKLFAVFQRLHSAEEFEGTGIGLANVQRIVLRHGGRTWAEGEPGRGATFYFSLPTRLEEPTEQAA